MVALLLIIVPGPDSAFTLGPTLGGRPVLAPVAGLTIGYTALTAVVSAGVGALVGDTPALLTVLTFAGGGYLMWQGISTLRHRPAPVTVQNRTTPAGWHTVVRGVGVSELNPKALLLFLALLPQFATPHHGWPVTVQLALLGVLFTLTCAAFYVLLGTVAATVVRARPRIAGVITRLSGAGMVVIGAVLIIEHFI